MYAYVKWSPSLKFPHQNPLCMPPLPHTCCMTCPFKSSVFDHPNIWWGIPAYKAPRHVVFSTPLLPSPSSTQISSSALYSQTPSAYISPSMWAIKIHTHIKSKKKYSSAYLKPCKMFRNKVIFHCENLFAPRPTPKLKDQPLSAVADCLFNTFAAILHIWWPFLHPQPCCGGGTHASRLSCIRNHLACWDGHRYRIRQWPDGYSRANTEKYGLTSLWHLTRPKKKKPKPKTIDYSLNWRSCNCHFDWILQQVPSFTCTSQDVRKHVLYRRTYIWIYRLYSETCQ